MASGPRVAVVGGGIIGMSIAWRLAQSGGSVTVFDAGRIGNESSWAGAGMLAPGGEYDGPSSSAEFAIESLGLYSEFVKELVIESHAEIDFRECGGFTVALNDEEASELRARAARQSQIGIYSEQFPASRVPGLRSGATAAQFYPHDAVVNPRDLMHALRIACTRLGVVLREFEPVSDVPGLPFDRVVLSAGAWSSQVSERLPIPRAYPVRGHLIAFDESSGLCDSLVRHGSLYLLRRAGNLVVAGASIEQVGFDRTLDGAAANQLANQAGELIPELRGRRFAAWNGFRPASETGEPVIGRVADSPVWLAYGHYRNGILQAPATARRVAREVLASVFTPASLQTDWSAPGVHQQ